MPVALPDATEGSLEFDWPQQGFGQAYTSKQPNPKETQQNTRHSFLPYMSLSFPY